ncbi:hypothetical protein [Paracoccus binzhouensis]|uniref:hypothetical protein n=1 Tax=Paracoccus binzhouensis TaxID=2796149 RepID=UPI0018EED5AB|nr:hypothetical protein [Paracoccus binzhouensis]
MGILRRGMIRRLRRGTMTGKQTEIAATSWRLPFAAGYGYGKTCRQVDPAAGRKNVARKHGIA